MPLSRRKPTVEWQVCGLCTYDCSYCIQGKSSRVGEPDAETADRIVDFLASLPGLWEVKMSGGEPFAAGLFTTRIVPGLAARTRHAISVLTNLSAPLPEIERFAAAARGRVGIVSASLHLEFAEPREFARRAVAFRSMLGGGTDFVVNSVLVPSRLPEVEEARRIVESAGLRFFPQLLKDRSTGKVHLYEGEELRLVEAIVGAGPVDPRRANAAPSYRGRLCWAGVDYFALTRSGDAWSCRSARRRGEGYLGNALDGSLRLHTEPSTCDYDICPCTVPANRGMIEGVGRGAAEYEFA